MNGRLLRRADLRTAERARMFALLSTHFHGVDRCTFDRDLDEKNWVLLFEDGAELRRPVAHDDLLRLAAGRSAACGLALARG